MRRAVLGLLLSGCVVTGTAVVGGTFVTGGYIYSNGEGRQQYLVSHRRLYEACEKFLEKRRAEIKKKSLGEGDAHLEGFVDGGREVRFRIQRDTPNTSTLAIKSGPAGDPTVTAHFHNEVARELEHPVK